jgi:hypothetical protein
MRVSRADQPVSYWIHVLGAAFVLLATVAVAMYVDGRALQAWLQAG